MSLYAKFARWRYGIKCPVCHHKNIPVPAYDGDTLGGQPLKLDPKYIHFMCPQCQYVFARQSISDFQRRCERYHLGEVIADILCGVKVKSKVKLALTYPKEDMQGGLITKESQWW